MRASRPYDLPLLEAARAGDREALLSLLAAAQPDIRRYARRSCRVSEDADEAVQKALLEIYHQMGTLRVLAAFPGWLFAIVRRECTRLAKYAFRWTDIDTPEFEARFANKPMEDLRLDIGSCIESLPINYREIVLLRDIEEMTIDEIGERLSLSRESVKARLHRARKMMREYLRP
ncbi:MAG: RNA polymerase sigma factor [Fibrobacteres bacterium]|jgi:RNA polymerase sigma factor (sigma-70 family)|nr:RNA polymerase sigma factor [Fibrobacterota bacterium]